MTASRLGESDIQPFEDDAHSVRGFLHVPAVASGHGLVLTHSAGANCQSPLLVSLAGEFCASGLTVLRCDLPFRQMRPHGPPPPGSAERDQQGLRSAVAALKRLVAGGVFMGGHSYGGRQASMLAAADPGVVDGLLLLSYPLHPLRRPDELRTKHFPRLHTPALFVQGTRDGFATVQEIEKALTLIPARTELLLVPGAGHELMRRAKPSDLPETVMKAFQRFFVG